MVKYHAPHTGAQNGAQPQPLAPDGQTFDFSRFDGKNDNAPKASQLDWKGVRALLSERRLTQRDDAAAKDGPLISGASYPDGATRGNAGVAFVSLAILDFDSGAQLPAIEAGVSKLNNGSGAAAILYSTFSHNPEASAHKYRLVIPLRSPVSGADWPDVWKRLAQAFDGTPDAKAKDAARIHYLPSCPKSREADAVFLDWTGEPLDVETLPELPVEAPKMPYTAPESRGGDAYARRAFDAEIGRLCITSASRNSALNEIARRLGQFVGAGRLDRSEVEAALMSAASANGYIAKDGEAEARRTMKSGLDAGEREPNHKGEPDPRHSSSKGAEKSEKSDFDKPDFSDLPKEEKAKNEAPSKLIRIGELRNRPAPNWLIQRFLVSKTTSLFTADSGSLKSFIALHIGYCVAHCLPFFGRGVQCGPVVYVAGEGGDGLRARSIAWDTHHERESPENLFVWESAVQIANVVEVAAFLLELERAGVKPALIIFDTLNRCAEGLDENSARDMGLFCAGLDRIKRATGAHVCVVHHNNAGGKSRGSTALPGAFDTRFSAERETDTVTLRCQKQKDGAAEFEPFALTARVVEIGEVDEYGDAITSLVLEPSDKFPMPQTAQAKSGAKERTCAAILAELATLHTAKTDGAKISKTDWEEAVVKAGICSRSVFYLRVKELETTGRWYWWKGDCRLEETGESPKSPTSPKSPKSDVSDGTETEKSEKSEKSQIPLGMGFIGRVGLNPPSNAKDTKKRGLNSKAARPQKSAAASEPYGAATSHPADTNAAAEVDEF
jgi:hypothetical protein